MTGINKEIIKLIEGRLEKGKEEYKQEVQVDDTRDFLIEALEEALDGQVYLSAEIIRLKKLRDEQSNSNSI